MKKRVLVVMVMIVAVVMVAGCKKKLPKVDTDCTSEGEFVCDPTGTGRMYCQDRKWHLQSCDTCVQKSSGIPLTGKSTTSSFSNCVGRGTGAVGASCSMESFDCDGSDFVRCKGGAGSTWERYKCPGPLGCKRVSRGIECDHTIATLGDACDKDDIACSTDHKIELVCTAGKWALAHTCGGPDACSATYKEGTTTVHCDTTYAPIGDPCKPNTGACSFDKQSLLICKDGKLAVGVRCRGGDCGHTDATTLNCLKSGFSEVGDPCSAGSSACRTDGKAFLDCKNGAFAFKQSCRACVATGSRVSCTP